MTQRRKGRNRERERDGFLGDLGRARAEKRRERASNLLAPSVGLGRPLLLLVRSPSLSRPFSISAPLSKSEREREKKESGVVNDCENPSSALSGIYSGNSSRRPRPPAPARSSPRKRLGTRDSGENVASLHAAWPRATREKKRLAITVAC